jgi:hypothetical protein
MMGSQVSRQDGLAPPARPPRAASLHHRPPLRKVNERQIDYGHQRRSPGSMMSASRDAPPEARGNRSSALDPARGLVRRRQSEG